MSGGREWRVLPKTDPPDEIRQLVGGHPLVAERIVRSGIIDPSDARAFLDPRAYRVTSPTELPDLEIAASRLRRAIRDREPILIWGDFDVDGQTATALLYTALEHLGANVRYHVPLRDGEGHGMNLTRLRNWIDSGIRLIVTCDTGISSHDAVALAGSFGIDVLITDHHLPGETLPQALAVVNPMRLPEGHRLRELPGVGVAWQLIVGLCAVEHALELPDLSDLLDLVALGIVADVAIQRNETRYLLQCGLEVARRTARPGLRALIETAGLSPLELDESDIAFGLGPRLNAQGRLGDARDSVELLVTRDESRASELASQLEGMNARRRLESRLIEESAHSLLEKDPSLLEYSAIVLAHPEWNGGIVGIVANRLADLHRRPVILLGERDGILAGSARSVNGCNITEALRDCAGLLIKYGGHPMAAGLSLHQRDLFEFRRLCSRAVRERVANVNERAVLEIDGYLSLNEVTRELVTDLRRLAPFGNGNPPLTLATRDLQLVRRRKLGRRGDHLDLLVEDRQGTRHHAIWWKAGDATIPRGSRFSLAYNPVISRFRGEEELILEVCDLVIRESDEPVLIGVDSETSRPVVEDCRHHPQPEVRLAEILSIDPEALVWREGNAESGIAGLRRDQLRQARTLIVWNAPPGPHEWESTLELVDPERLIVFDQPVKAPTLDTFLTRLGGLIKFVLNSRGGSTTLAELAGVLAEREDAIRHGLRWFVGNGQILIELRQNGTVKIVRLESGKREPQPAIESLIRATLAETVAFRKTWSKDLIERPGIMTAADSPGAIG